MPEQKLTIVPITLHSNTENILTTKSTASSSSSTCTITNALTKAAEYTLNRADGLRAFLNDGRIEIDYNPTENATRPNVIGRKNWLFPISEAGAKENAICLSIVETAKANGVDFYQYLVGLLRDLPNLDIHRNPEVINNYLPWSKTIQAECGK